MDVDNCSFSRVRRYVQESYSWKNFMVLCLCANFFLVESAIFIFTPYVYVVVECEQRLVLCCVWWCLLFIRICSLGGILVVVPL